MDSSAASGPGAGLVPPRLEHAVPFRRAGTYAPFPLLEAVPGGRLALAFPSNDGDHQDRGFVFDWNVLVSADGDSTWGRAYPRDAAIPYTWQGSGPRERWDRFARALPGGTLVAAGAIGWTAWPATRREEAVAQGLSVSPHPGGDATQIVVAPSRVFAQRSRDGGATWERREWPVPGGYRLTGFPRPAVLSDGTFLVPLYDIYPEEQSHRDRNLLLRSADGGESWTLTSADGGHTWDVAHRALLRGDGQTRRRGDRESRDLGYPVSLQLPDGSLLTAYYLTLDGVTHIATTRWELPW